jgi:phosphopantetheinyl transferase (holo-ACP synthase)
MMEEKIKEIVSVYIRVPAAQIGESTPIDRAALQSSILLHRMYAKLAEEGVVVSDYAGMKVFGDLMRRQGGAGGAGGAALLPRDEVRVASPGGAVSPGIGIDIEEIAALPRAADFRREAFYTQNFTAGEIAYCILQADPYSSLTGLFAVKEAIVKADGQYRGRPFNTIEIGHTAEGKPEFPGFGLSISHAGGMAVAVAVRAGAGAGAGAVQEAVSTAALPSPMGGGRKSGAAAWIGWMALLLAAAALLVALKH